MKPRSRVLGKRGRRSAGERLDTGAGEGEEDRRSQEEAGMLEGLRELSFRKGRRLLEEVRRPVLIFRLL